MYAEFPSICRELIRDAEERLNNLVGLKVKLIRNCEFEISKNSNQIKDKLSAMIMNGLQRNLMNMNKDDHFQEPTTPFHTQINRKKNIQGYLKSSTLQKE